MDFEALKKGIAEISTICKDVPEAFQAKCFERLLEALLEAQRPPRPSKDTPKDKDKERGKEQSQDNHSDPEDQDRGDGSKLVLPGVVKAFLRKTELTDTDLAAIIMMEDDEFHFIKEPSHKNNARGQNEWALLTALKSAIVGEAFTADPEVVRSVVQEKGYYDKGNFAKIFKREPYSKYYKGTMEAQGEAQGLTKEGETALAALIKSLGA